MPIFWSEAMQGIEIRWEVDYFHPFHVESFVRIVRLRVRCVSGTQGWHREAVMIAPRPLPCEKRSIMRRSLRISWLDAIEGSWRWKGEPVEAVRRNQQWPGLVPSLEPRIGIPGESRTVRLKDQRSIHHSLEAKDSDLGSAGRSGRD